MSDRAYANAQAQQKTLTGSSSKNSLLQRTCACGQHTIAGGECEACRKTREGTMQRAAVNSAPVNGVPPVVHDVLSSPGQPLDAGTRTFMEPCFGHDFSRIPIHSTQTPMPQTKLKVNQPGDVYEREADQVAEQVMRMTDLEPSASDNEDEAKNSLMRKQSTERGASTTTKTADVPPIVHDVLNSGGGRPLDTTTREFMEPRFGYDFSRVRVHTGARASESAQSVNALAYTVGRDVVFGAGQYVPETTTGRKLLVHELTHVVQQGSGVTSVQQNIPFIQRQELPNSEPLTQDIPSKESERRYNLEIGSNVLENATKEQVLQALQRYRRHIAIQIEGGEEGHKYLKALRDEQWIVGFFADTLGGVSMPPLSIWEKPKALLSAAESTINAGLVETSVQNLTLAEEAYRRAYRTYYGYQEGTISGAETSVTVLKVTAAAGAVAATVATGGAAAGAGASLLTTSAAVGVAGGAYGATQELAGQTGEKIAGTRSEFDFTKVLRRGAKDAIVNFVGSIAGGALSGYFTRTFGSYLSNVEDKVLIELGEQLGLVLFQQTSLGKRRRRRGHLVLRQGRSLHPLSTVPCMFLH